MKIIDTRVHDPVELKTLKNGDFFEYNGTLYMVIPPKTCTLHNISDPTADWKEREEYRENVFNFKNRNSETMLLDTDVVSVDVEIHIKCPEEVK